jgi:hypothetical protein
MTYPSLTQAKKTIMICDDEQDQLKVFGQSRRKLCILMFEYLYYLTHLAVISFL